MNEAEMAQAPAEEVPHFTLGELVPDLQYRITELAVCNWGMFKGIWRAPIDPKGTLICGDTGAGKSTFIDGMQMVLVKPTAARFNTAASGEEARDRTLVTYVRGKDGNVRDGGKTVPRMKRPGATYSAVSTRFEGTDGSTVTLMAVFWIPGPGNALSDVKRVYIVARRKLDIEEVLDIALSERSGINLRTLEQHYGDDPAVVLRQKWDAYEAEFMGALGVENPKAPALIIKAMGLKEVPNLNNLIREFVLEAGTGYENAKDAVAEFRDLEAVQIEMSDAQRQAAQLSKLEGLNATIVEKQDVLDGLNAERDGLPIFVAEQARKLLDTRLQQQREQETAQRGVVADADSAVKAADTALEQAHRAWVLSGGQRVEELKRQEVDLEAAISRAAENERGCTTMAPRLGLGEISGRMDREGFNAIRAKAAAMAADADGVMAAAREAMGQAFGEAARIGEEKVKVDQELADLKRRGGRSNFTERYQMLRDALVENFALDPDSLVFLGEMVQVPGEYAHLQGAIERALGKAKLTLLIPEAASSQITGFMNSRKLGLDLRIEAVRERAVAPAQFKDRGFLRLLDWRKHPYREVAKRILSSRDRVIVGDVDELQRTPWAMTAQGLMSFDPGVFEKRDSIDIDNRDYWNTGHDGSVRLQVLAKAAADLQEQLQKADRLKDDKSAEQQRVSQTLAAAEAIGELTWNDVDVAAVAAQRQEVQGRIVALEREDADLADAQAKYNEAKEALHQVRSAEREAREVMSRLQGSIGRDKDRLDGFVNTIGGRQVDEAVAARLAGRGRPITLDTLDREGAMGRELREDIDSELNTVSTALTAAAQQATSVMSAYQAIWSAQARDLRTTPNSIDGYLEILEHIRTDRLVELESRFKEKLNHNSLQSLDQVLSAIESQEEEIEARIDDVNTVMNRVDFHSGARLVMQIARKSYVEIDDFEHKIAEVRRLAASEDADARYEALRSVMNDLAFHTDPSRANNQATQRLLDARYRLEFSAELIDVETEESINTLDGTEGLSGGQRESFSNFVVAASLAYALTPSGGQAPRLSTVFLDEAFSRTSTSMIKSIIEVFRVLKLHMNLITPYKELDTSEQATRAVVMVEHDKRTGLSELKHITWDKFDEVRLGMGSDRLPPGEVKWRKDAIDNETTG